LLKMWLKEERHNQCGLGLRIFVKAWLQSLEFLRRHDTQHNDTQLNDIKHSDTQNNDTQHNNIQHNDVQNNK
jgi:hypothetical protein